MAWIELFGQRSPDSSSPPLPDSPRFSRFPPICRGGRKGSGGPRKSRRRKIFFKIVYDFREKNSELSLFGAFVGNFPLPGSMCFRQILYAFDFEARMGQEEALEICRGALIFFPELVALWPEVCLSLRSRVTARRILSLWGVCL